MTADQLNSPTNRARSPETASGPVRVLLWAPYGSGNHYHGPASFSYRLYSGAAPGRFRLALAYGTDEQTTLPLFESQHQISRLVMRRSKPLQTWQFLHRSKAWLRAHAREFDVMHALTAFHVSLAPAFEAQQLGLPGAVFMSTQSVELGDKGGIRRFLGLPKKRRMMIRSIAAVIAMSDAIEQELLSVGVEQKRIARIPMGVDMHRFHPAASLGERSENRARLGWPDRFSLAFVGGLNSRKQPHLLIDALALLVKSGIDAQIAMIGPTLDAAYVDRMKEQARDSGVADRVIWHGFTEDPAPLFRAADAFALPSLNEGMPAAMVEAMASGLPVIATAISGATDLIREGECGLFVTPDAESLARVWTSYATDVDRTWREGQTARRMVGHRYSQEVVLNAYERLFRRIAAGGDAAE